MIYDVAIIGSGVSGAAIARTLSRYDLKVVILEKEADVAWGTSKANSGIIHGGFHHNLKYLKSKLEIKGNLMFDQLKRELDFPFSRPGIIVAALNEEELKIVEHLYHQGVENNSIGIEMVSRERLLELSPKLNADVVGGLYAPSGGIVEPYRFVFSLIESAKKNGVEVITDFEVVAPQPPKGGASQKKERVSTKALPVHFFEIDSKDGRKVKAKYVINAAGLFADEISKMFNAEEFKINPRKGEYFLLDKATKANPHKVIFPVPSKISKGVLVIPTNEGTVLIGPTADEIEDKEDLTTSNTKLRQIFDSARKMVPIVSERDIITSFAGLRPALDTGDFYIDISKKCKNFIQVAGIQSPGLTAAPAIGEYVKDLLKDLIGSLVEKKDYDPYIQKLPTIRNMDAYEVSDLVNEEPRYGNVVCRCENISEMEIVNAIEHGHTTLDGIKFFTRAGMGRCQGGFCTYKTIKIIMKETGLAFDKVTKKGKDSFIITHRL
jgi:glycerol-3-phosphate dehydrogenase